MPERSIPETTLHRELDGETVLVNLQSGEYYGLDEVGTHVWRLLAEGCTTEEICRSVVASYDVTAERAADDVRALLEELEAHGLVDRAP